MPRAVDERIDSYLRKVRFGARDYETATASEPLRRVDKKTKYKTIRGDFEVWLPIRRFDE